MKKKEVPPNSTPWMDFEGIILSEISQRLKNTIWSHLYVESKNIKLIEIEKISCLGLRSRQIRRYWLNGTNFQLQDI